MPKTKRIKETDLYPIVERWVKRHFHCFRTAIDKGLKYSRIDVLGIKDIGGDLSGEIETIAIEVKKGNTPFAKASGQTLGYRVYVNRVYLADLRDNAFSTDEINIASNLGIGLIQIRGKSCREILTSPYYNPISKLNLTLLERIAIGKCQFCGSFFETGNHENNRFSNLTREDVLKSVKQEKGLMYWNYEAAFRKNQFDAKRAKNHTAYERRFVCSECIEIFFAPFVTAAP